LSTIARSPVDEIVTIGLVGSAEPGRILAVVATLQVSGYETELSDAAIAPSSTDHRWPARRADRGMCVNVIKHGWEDRGGVSTASDRA
jgi:hypothetical protein